MTKIRGLGALLALCLFAHLASAQDVRLAVIRIPSHGCSGTVVQTEQDRSIILTCAHAFSDQAALSRKLSLDIPSDPNGNLTPRTARMKVLGVDAQKDVALISVELGPLPVVCPFAPNGHRPSSNIWSVGYDEMTWPAVVRKATIVDQQNQRYWTKERPWHGRSGGGLIDLDNKVLIGVVSAYSGPRTKVEVVPGAFGLYVDHPTCLDFVLRILGGGSQPAPAPKGEVGRLRIEQISDSTITQPLAHTAPGLEPKIDWSPRVSETPLQRPPQQQFVPPPPCPDGNCPGRR